MAVCFACTELVAWIVRNKQHTIGPHQHAQDPQARRIPPCTGGKKNTPSQTLQKTQRQRGGGENMRERERENAGIQMQGETFLSKYTRETRGRRQTEKLLTSPSPSLIPSSSSSSSSATASSSKPQLIPYSPLSPAPFPSPGAPALTFASFAASCFRPASRRKLRCNLMFHAGGGGRNG